MSTTGKVTVVVSSGNVSSGDPNTTLRIPGPGPLGSERFPCSVVWTLLPCIGWFLPFIGHMGVCNSEGICYDFAGPYYISEDQLSFGRATRYFSIVPYLFPSPQYKVKELCDGSYEVRVNNPGSSGGEIQKPADRLAMYDKAVARQTDRFRRTQNYSFCCNNCHSFTASVLEDGDAGEWNMVTLAARIFLMGKFVSFMRGVATFLPFVIIATIIGILSWKVPS